MGTAGERRLYEFVISHKRVWRLATEAEAEEYRATGRVPGSNPTLQKAPTRWDVEQYYGADLDEANEW